MTQQISIEDAFPTFQKQCRELFEANLLLRTQVDVLERKLAAMEQPASEEPVSGQPPVSGGPDLAAQPPYPTTSEPRAAASRAAHRSQ